jgi:hypothetical protein
MLKLAAPEVLCSATPDPAASAAAGTAALLLLLVLYFFTCVGWHSCRLGCQA